MRRVHEPTKQRTGVGLTGTEVANLVVGSQTAPGGGASSPLTLPGPGLCPLASLRGWQFHPSAHHASFILLTSKNITSSSMTHTAALPFMNRNTAE